MKPKNVFLFLCLLFVFTSCKVYELKHYKSDEIDKIREKGKLGKYNIYLNYKNETYRVNEPSLSSDEISGELVPVKEPGIISEIRNPKTPVLLKKHKQDINLYTETPVKEDSSGSVQLKKKDITDVSRIVSHSKVTGEDIEKVISAIIALAICIVLIGALIYWFSLV